MIKIILKGAGIAEKPKVYVDGEVAGKVSNSKPTILNLDNKKHLLQIKNANGSSKAIKVQDPGEDDILLLEYVATLKAFTDERYVLKNDQDLNEEIISTNDNISNNQINIKQQSPYHTGKSGVIGIIIGGLIGGGIALFFLTGGFNRTPNISGTYVDSETGCKLIVNASSANLKCDIVGRNDNFVRYKMTKADDIWSDYDVMFYYDNDSNKGISCYIGKDKTNKSISCQFAGGIVNFYK